MERCAAWVTAGALLMAGAGSAMAAGGTDRRPADYRTDLQQFGFPIAQGTSSERSVDPVTIQIVSAYGGGISPRQPDFIYVPSDGGNVDPDGGLPERGRAGARVGAHSVSSIRIPATAAILPREARNYVLQSVASPQTPAHRSETLRALWSLSSVPVAQARRMFTPPAFLQSGQKATFFKAQIQKLAAQSIESPRRFAIIVAPADGESAADKSHRAAATAGLSFPGVAADALLSGLLRGAAEEKTLQDLGAGITSALSGNGQVWFANGVETVLPHTSAALYNTDGVGGIVTAGSQGAKAVRVSDPAVVSDAISMFGTAVEANQESPTGARTVQAIVDAVGPTALLTYAPDASQALAGAQAIRANKRFGSAGTVVVLLQGSGGTELLLF